jgi:MSHA pilin protein MshA
MKKQTGFTLIELIMVIVILGILAATALPKFVNLSSDAETASAQGIAGALSSAGTINYAQKSLHPASGVVTTTGTQCNTLGGLMEGGAFPANATIGGTTPNCTVTVGGSAAIAAYVPTIP